MKRVTQHIIEEESRKAFALLVPDAWVANDFTKDYGKDIHIEIFSNHSSTGNTFIVQLKGTSQKITGDEIAIRIGVEMLSYYESLDIPVLLVFYSTCEKKNWAIWANGLLHCLNVREGQATVVVKLNAKHLIGVDFFKGLERDFTKEIPWRIHIAVDSNTMLEKTFERRIIRWLEKYYPGSYGLNKAHYPFRFVIKLTEVGKHLSVDLNLNGDKIPLQPIKKDELGFITSPIVSPDTLQKEEAEILLFITSTFSKFYPQNSLLLLQKIIVLYHGKYKNDITLFQIGDFALDANCLFELQQLIDVTLQEQLLYDFNYLNMALFRQKKTLENYKANLIRAVDMFPATKEKGTLCYNLGNMYRSQHEFTLAVHYYNLARKLRPDYTTKFYWWHEFAGILFLSQHYFYAALFYQKAIELDKQRKNLPFTYALHADCLLWQGKYKEAMHGYDSFLRQVVKMDKIPSPYQSMMHEMCKEFIEMDFEEKKLDVILSSKLYWEAVESNDAESFSKSLEAYPLNFHAWRSLGYLYQSQNKYVEAFYALKNAALLQEVDKDTWLQCYAMCIKADFDQYSTLVFSHLVFQFGENILDDINVLVCQSSDASFEEQEKIMFQLFENAKYLMENVIKDIYMPPPIVMRVMDDEEFYEVHPPKK